MKTGVAITSALAAVLLLSLALAVHPALAEEPPVKVGEPPKIQAPKKPEVMEPDVVAHLERIKKVLSGPVELVVSGVDPRLWVGKPKVDPVTGRWQDTPGSALQQLQAAGGAAALVPYRDPSAKFSRNILIPRDFSRIPYQTEPHLAVNPKDPDHIVVGMIDYNFPTVTNYVSIDGGATWEGPFQVKYPRDEWGSAGDPTVAIDREGNAYFSYISLDVDEFTICQVAGSGIVSSVALSRSEDGGFTWQSPVPTSKSRIETTTLPADERGRCRGEVAFGFLDKPWMTVGPHPKDPQQTVIYVTYTKFVSRYGIYWVDELPFLSVPIVETVIELVRSEDGGATWSAPLKVSPTVRRVYGEPEEFTPPSEGLQLTPAEEAQGTRRFVQGSQSVVAPDGTVYVTWLDTTDDGPFEGLGEIYVARSDDGGKSFSRPLRAVTFLEPGYRPRTSYFRYWGTAFPQVAVGPQGEVYIVYTAIPPENPDDDSDVYLIRSLDKGQTWSRRKRVNDDQTSRLQFFPAVSVSPKGVVQVMWGDMRDDAFETRYHIYHASSEDRGETWSLNSRVTDFPSNPNYGFPYGAFIGDYFALKAVEEDVYMVWADTRLGEYGSLNQKIGFARQRLMPMPSIFVSPPAGPGGQEVTIQGFNFQPDQYLYIEVGGVVVATAYVHEEGRFSTRIFIPISGSGAHDVRVMDASGNAATSSFFMDFGFGDVKGTKEQLAGLTGQVAAVEQTLKSTAVDTSKALTGEIQGLRQAVDTLAATEAERGKAMPLWLVAVIAAAIAAVATATAMLLLWRLAPRGRREGQRL